MSLASRCAGVDYVHPHIPRPEADALMKSAGTSDGIFFYRHREPGQDGLILGVIFRNQPTYHLLKWDDATGAFTINGKPLPECTTVKLVTEYLRTKRAFWPVPLTTSIPYAGTSTAASTPAAPVVSSPPPVVAESPAPVVQAAPAPVAPTPAPVSKQASSTSVAGAVAIPVHANLPKDEAEQLLTASGTTEGKFLFRERAVGTPSNDDFILSVIYKSRATHHLVLRDPTSGCFTINKAPIPQAATLETVVAFLRQARSFWPVPLTEMVSPATPSARPSVAAVEPTPAAVVADDSAAQAAERARQEQLERERVEKAKAEEEARKREEERAMAEKVKREQEAAEQAEREKAERENAERERAERDQAEQARLEQERAQQAENERIERERQEQERQAREQQERELAEQQRIKEEQERQAHDQAEQERVEQERMRRENEERARAELVRLQQEEDERTETLRLQKEQRLQEEARLEHQRQQQAAASTAIPSERREIVENVVATFKGRGDSIRMAADQWKQAALLVEPTTAAIFTDREEESRPQEEPQQEEEPTPAPAPVIAQPAPKPTPQQVEPQQTRTPQKQPTPVVAQQPQRVQDPAQTRERVSTLTPAMVELGYLEVETRAEQEAKANAAQPKAATPVAKPPSATPVAKPSATPVVTPARAQPQTPKDPEPTEEERILAIHKAPLPPGFFSQEIRRTSTTESFGFGVASVWTPQRRLTVISFVAEHGFAHGKLQPNDVLSFVNGHDVQTMDLEEVKQLLRQSELVVYLRFSRSQQQSQQLQQHLAQSSPSKKAKEGVKCSGTVWCPCGKCAKQAEKEERRLILTLDAGRQSAHHPHIPSPARPSNRQSFA
eukprot:m.813709 g.813709  ORF g.813709 m.813709 type:complete len:847 (-) comp59361_c0_seq1:125-2665(-)